MTDSGYRPCRESRPYDADTARYQALLDLPELRSPASGAGHPGSDELGDAKDGDEEPGGDHRVVDDIPSRLCADELLATNASLRPLPLNPPAGGLCLLELLVPLSVSSTRVDIAEAEPVASTAELASVDIELLLDPSGMITQLLAYIDLTELVKEQPGRDKAPKIPRAISRPASVVDSAPSPWITRRLMPVPEAIGSSAKSFARKSVIPAWLLHTSWYSVTRNALRSSGVRSGVFVS
jgi:hypothetical protein